MKLKTVYIGIDPGQSGGIAISEYPIAWKMPDTEADTAELLRETAGMGENCVCLIEAVHSFPGQGVTSSFTFGRHYGLLRGLLVGLRIPFEEISPQAWQKEMNCRTGGDKNVSKAKAQQLWPGIKITHATADALLISECARRRAIEVKIKTDWRVADNRYDLIQGSNTIYPGFSSKWPL